MMKLTDKELELMIKVRDRMKEDYYDTDRYLERAYICHNIVQIENGLDRFDDGLEFRILSDKEGSLSASLIGMINAGIEHNVAFDIYLEELDIGLNWSTLVSYFTQLGRLAWLDRIVETGEIA
jgi:hypothetical protein